MGREMARTALKSAIVWLACRDLLPGAWAHRLIAWGGLVDA
jgi:hypothetical protein